MMSGEMAGQMAARSSHFKSVLISLNLFVLVGKKLLSSSFSANALLSMTCHTFSHNPKSASNRSMMRLMSTSCLPLLIAAANPNNERDALSSALFTALVRLTRCFKTLPPGPEVAGFLLLAVARAVTPGRAMLTRLCRLGRYGSKLSTNGCGSTVRAREIGVTAQAGRNQHPTTDGANGPFGVDDALVPRSDETL